VIEQHTIVAQVPGAHAYTTLRPYTGTDLSQVFGVSQARMPDGTYGWIQTRGETEVKGQLEPAYVDFEPNDARRRLSEEPSGITQDGPAGLPPGLLGETSITKQKDERLAQLPALLIQAGPYCDLLREAREVFADGNFYACVAMCGISLERFQRDKAKQCGATRHHKIWQVREMLHKDKILKPTTLELCENMACLRNDYAHGDGQKPEDDARQALDWMSQFIESETDLMRDYVIQDGLLIRKHAEPT
jgi:hypothetical protein